MERRLQKVKGGQDDIPQTALKFTSSPIATEPTSQVQAINTN